MQLPHAAAFLQGYEPYILIHRDFVPWYDERFDARWWDKVRGSSVAAVAALLQATSCCTPAN